MKSSNAIFVLGTMMILLTLSTEVGTIRAILISAGAVLFGLSRICDTLEKMSCAKDKPDTTPRK